MSLPWEKFGPEEPEPELPYVPPSVPLPIPPSPPIDLPPQPLPPTPAPATPVVDWSQLLDDAWPLIKDQLLGYVKGTVQAGFDVDHAHPTITATTAAGKELVVADARNRSARTFIQGLIFDLFAGLIAVVATLAGADPFQKETWIAFGVLLLKTFVSAAISYVMRLRVTPTVRTKGEQMQVMPLMVPKPEEATAA